MIPGHDRYRGVGLDKQIGRLHTLQLRIVLQNRLPSVSRRCAVSEGESNDQVLEHLGAAEAIPGVDEMQKQIEELEKERDKLQSMLEKDEPLHPFQVELLKLQRHLEASQTPMIVIFEGRDASGKGGTIRRVNRYLNEKRARVVALGKPTDLQRTQWYFQRYVKYFPSGGEIVLFDRSWYTRALVEPVFGFCTKDEYRDFLRGVVGFEKDLVRQGTVLVKLYFSVDKETQAKRFDRRRNDPLRQWKLSEIDVQAQDLWNDFTEMKHRMLERTSTGTAPWTIIRSNNKTKARLNTMKVILNSIDYADRNEDLDFRPDPEVVISGEGELKRMDKERDKLGRPRG
jgi:polyphosphate kinase 2